MKTHTQVRTSGCALKNFKPCLQEAPQFRRDNYVIVQSKDDEKILERLMDIELKFEIDELTSSIISDYILHQKCGVRKFISSIKQKLADIDIDIDDITDIQENTMDIIKHDDEYFFWDNVLDRRMISTTQRYGKTNLTKDNFKTNFINQKISRTPITRYYSPSEYLELRNDNRVTTTISQVILNTKFKNFPYPTKEEILSPSQIKSERRDDDKRINFYKQAYAYDNYYRHQDLYEAYGRDNPTR